MPWISAEVWNKMREDMTHRVQTSAGISNRLKDLGDLYNQLAEGVAQLAAEIRENRKAKARPKRAAKRKR